MTLSNLGAHRAAAAFVVTLAASPSLVSAQADPAAQDGLVERHYDLGPALTAGVPPPPGVIMELHVSTSAIDALEPAGYDVRLGPDSEMDVDECLHVIRSALEGTKGAEHTDLSYGQRWLNLTGNAAAHRAAAAALAQLEALNLDSVDVEVLVIPRTPALVESAGWISGEETATLLRGAPAHLRSLFPVRIGRRATLDQTRTRSFLYDYDVEVAQGAMVGDPTVSILRTGTQLGVRVDHAADGTGFVVRTWGRSGEEAAAMRSVKLPFFADSVIELPSVHSSIWTSSARLAPGEAMVIDHGTEGLMLLRILESTTPDATPRISLGAHALSAMRPEIPRLPRAEPSGGYGIERESVGDFGPEGSMDTPNMDDLLELIGLGDLPTLGTHLMVPHGSKAAEAASAAIQALAKANPINEYSIDVRFQVLDAEGSQALRGASDWSSLASDPSTSRLASTALGQDATLLVSGIETAYLQDHDAEIAAGAVGPNPIPRSTFQGASIWCSPMKTASGELRAWFDVQVQQEPEVLRTVTAASYHAAPGSGSKDNPRALGEMRLDLPIELAVTESAGGTCLTRLNEGEWGHVLTQPFGTSGRELVVIAKITTR